MHGIVNFKKDKIFEIISTNEKEILSYRFQNNVYTIIFSGHIYNRNELKELLVRKNIELESGLEIEIVLKLYLVYGKESIERLNGAYSFAIWNEREKELFIVRDRFGLEPFYYAMKNGSFIFASSIKDILKHSEIKAQLDSTRNK